MHFRSSRLLPQRIEIRCDVVSLIVVKAKIRHGRFRFDLTRMSNPTNEIFLGVRQLPGNHGALAEIKKWRPDQSIGAMHSGDYVTASAAIALDQFLAALWIAADRNRIGAQGLAAIASHEQQRHSNRANAEHGGHLILTQNSSHRGGMESHRTPMPKVRLTKTPRSAMNSRRSVAAACKISRCCESTRQFR